MVKDKEIRFICKECNEIIGAGKCGDHRINTGHKEFDVVNEKEDEEK